MIKNYSEWLAEEESENSLFNIKKLIDTYEHYFVNVDLKLYDGDTIFDILYQAKRVDDNVRINTTNFLTMISFAYKVPKWTSWYCTENFRNYIKKNWPLDVNKTQYDFKRPNSIHFTREFAKGDHAWFLTAFDDVNILTDKKCAEYENIQIIQENEWKPFSIQRAGLKDNNYTSLTCAFYKELTDEQKKERSKIIKKIIANADLDMTSLIYLLSDEDKHEMRGTITAKNYGI